MVVSVDELVLSPLGDAMDLGNDVTLQVRRPRVEGRPGAVWLRETMESWCGRLSPVWATAYHEAEYESKAMSDDRNRIASIGRDFGSHLPGLFWCNFFGWPYVRLLGEERLKSVPSKYVATVGDGVVIQLSEDPREWDKPAYAAAEQQVRDHLGNELFFSKADPNRRGLVPDWNA